jgi:hypothetical protein
VRPLSSAWCQLRTSRGRRAAARLSGAGPKACHRRDQAEKRCIFTHYAELGAVRLLKDELEACRVTSDSWTSAPSPLWGAKPLAHRALYLMLQNRVYRGELVHRKRWYPGEHSSIIDRKLWDVQVQPAAANDPAAPRGAVDPRRRQARAVDGSPLSGKELSRERRRTVKDARSIFDRGFELAAFVPLVP